DRQHLSADLALDEPENVSRGDATDVGWSQTPNNRLYGSVILQDSNPNGSNLNLGGPYASSLPILYANGHVKSVPYSAYVDQWAAFAPPSNPGIPSSDLTGGTYVGGTHTAGTFNSDGSYTGGTATGGTYVAPSGVSYPGGTYTGGTTTGGTMGSS